MTKNAITSIGTFFKIRNCVKKRKAKTNNNTVNGDNSIYFYIFS